MAHGRKELRDEQLFARLIGAAVLLALAVIILPFVLDGSGSQREYEYIETLPPEPPRSTAVESSFSSRQEPLRTNKPDTAAGLPALETPGRDEVKASVPATTPLTDLPVSRVLNSTNTTGQLTDSVATAAENGQGRSVSGGSSGNVSGSVPERVNGLASGIDSVPVKPGWNIQVASFVRDANAVKLINRLRRQNLPAYANRVQGSQRAFIRVLVGPYGSQVDALTQQNDIDRDYRVESLIVKGG